MAIRIDNTFTTWQFDTDTELRASQIFTGGNINHIQNQMSLAAQEKVNLTFDPANPMVFVQQEAALAGQIKLCQYLIDAHNAAVESTVLDIRSESQSNRDS